MTKPRATEDQLAYERQVVESKQKSYKRLSQQADAYERKLTDIQVKSAIAARDKALAYERKITDQQFDNISHVNDEHRIYHEREHLLYEDAIEKASVSLAGQLSVLKTDLDRVEAQLIGFMPVARFERDHLALIDRYEREMKALRELHIRDIASLAEKVADQEKVTIRQDTTQTVLDKLATNNRWLIGITATSGLALLSLILHLMGLY